jgi:hypothetical protein
MLTKLGVIDMDYSGEREQVKKHYPCPTSTTLHWFFTHREAYLI